MVLVCQKLPTDVASPCVHCFREAISVQHAYLYCRGGGSGVADVAVAIPMSNKVGLSHTINWR